jgi:predicted PurR-regulated permease PerM
MLAPARRPTPATDPISGAAMLVAAAILVAFLYLGREVLVPLVIAGFLAFVLAPVARGLQRLGLPWGSAVILAVLGGLLAVGGLGLALGAQLAEFVGDLPRYADALRQRFGAVASLGHSLRELMASLRGAEGAAPVAPAPAQPEATTLELAGMILGPVLHPLATAALVAFFATLILLYRDDLRDRVIRLAGARDLHRTVSAMDDAAERLSRLFAAQAILNASYGAAVGLVLWALGLPAPILWGLLAGVMRFVPFIGTPLAVLPPTILALAIMPGWGWPVGIFLFLLLSEAFMGQVAEPMIFGSRTGLSPLSIILSASFWTMLWGPIGLLIATPLTVGLVVLGRHVPQLEFLDVVLGDRPPLRPEESFYQRAIAGDADGLVAQAREALEEGSLAAYADDVALRGLALAQTDWTREALEAERLEDIRLGVTTMLDDVAEKAEAAPRADLPRDWAAEGAVLCLPARGQLDDLSARIAALVLGREGFGAAALGPAALDAANIEALDPERVRLCCLSVMEEGNSVAGVRTFLRRLQRHLPEARVIVGLWHAPPESAMLAALRREGPAEAIVTTVGEAAALCEAIARRAEEAQQPASR